jgi:phage terminase large subunit
MVITKSHSTDLWYLEGFFSKKSCFHPIGELVLMKEPKKVILKEIVGKGYKSFWNSKHRYRIVKGSRASKKSATAALNLIYNIMKYPLAHGLVIRRFDNTHRDSTFAKLKWAIGRLGVKHLFDCRLSPIEIIYRPTGQKILFRGMNDPESITSIDVEFGNICFIWWEEFFQMSSEEAFNKVDLSFRGIMPEGYFIQHTMTMNPWSDKIWCKKRFFDNPDKWTFSLTTNYLINEFLSPQDYELFEQIKATNPRRYTIEGLGEWGISEGLIYDNWEEREFSVNNLRQMTDKNDNHVYTQMHGLDFGYSNDPTALCCFMASEKLKEIWIFDEMYKIKMTNQKIANTITYMGYGKEKIIADSSEPKSIDELKIAGLNRITAAKKGADSVRAGIQKLQDYKIYVHPKCINTIVEFSNYIWKKDNETDKVLNDPIDEFSHLMDALRYGAEVLGGNNFSF